MWFALSAGLSFALAGSSAAQGTVDGAQLSGLRQKIEHVIVIYQENWSFDGLYAKFPGANGAKETTPQVQCPIGGVAYVPMAGSPPALIVAGRPTGPWPCGWQGLSG